MTSIVRIKRRLSQEPAEALLLAAKRSRVDSDGAFATQESVFKFYGTSNNEKEDLASISKLFEKRKKMEHRQTTKTIRTFRPKPLEAATSTNSDKKYKVLSTLRNIDSTADSDLKVYDLVLERDDVVTCNGVPLVVESCKVDKEEEKFAYDYYYSEQPIIDDSYIDQLLSVQPYFYGGEDDDESEHDDEDEDSNDENHHRNDYPDTDEDEDGHEDLVGRMTGMYLNNDSDMSSEDEDFVYSKDDDEPIHGAAYSEYKKRVIKELNLDSEDFVNSMKKHILGGTGPFSQVEEDGEVSDFEDID